MFRYGFELEGFFEDEAGVIVPPDRSNSFPKDGFPGLCELRTTGGKCLHEAGAELLGLALSYNLSLINFRIHEHKFSGEEMAYIRKHFRFEKDQVDVKNIYGKKPRALNGRTLASFQINISNQLSESRKDKDVYIPAQYGLLDVHGIVLRLDKAFATDIKNSNRQPGMYAIKDNYRLEYRSLPNFSWHMDEPYLCRSVLNRIKDAVEG